MNVAILTNDLITNGGAPRQAMLLARGLAEQGHRAKLYAVHYCEQDCFPEIAATLDIRAVHRLTPDEARAYKSRKHHGLLDGVKRHLWASRQLARLIEPCDVLNPHTRGATRAAVRCKQRTGTPVVWMCDDARNWEERGYRTYYPASLQWMFDQSMARLEKPVVHEIDRIVALDHRVAKILAKYYGRPAEVVRSGLDAVSFRPSPDGRAHLRAGFGWSDQEFVLLWLGILEPHRHIEDALEALHLLRRQGRSDIRFLIAGSAQFAPDYLRKLQLLAAKYGLGECVRFHAQPIPESEMPSYYSAADALVYLAENQCWGLGVFEALACNLPVIISRACGAHEVLEDRRTAMLVSPRSPAELAQAIVCLADLPALRRKLIAHARAEVLDRITWKAYTENMVRVFHKVAGGGCDDSLPAAHEAFA